MHFFEGIGDQRYSKRFLKRNKHETEAFRKLLTNDWRNRLFILYCRQMENPIAKFYPPQKNSRLKYQWSSQRTTKNTPSAQTNEQTTQILSQLDFLDLNKSNSSKLTFFFDILSKIIQQNIPDLILRLPIFKIDPMENNTEHSTYFERR